MSYPPITEHCVHGHFTKSDPCPWCELESLRQENSRLRERMNQLTDDYEGTIKRLREALRVLIDADQDRHRAQLSGLETGYEHPGTQVMFRRAVLLAKKALNPPKNR